MHTSQLVPGSIEFLEINSINPLISKCKIKVCYVGDEPNRNQSIITEDAARIIAKSLRGSPIVGYFNKEKGDFEEHNRFYKIENGRIQLYSNTRPYGFVDVNAKVWFEECLDDNAVYRKYLATEGYIWTGQYPESKSIVEGDGKPQSLEFSEDPKYLNAFWTTNENGNNQFFIINEAVIEKLCVLGEDVEPCFEGASVTHFTLEPKVKQEIYSLITDIKNILEKGGLTVMEENKVLDNIEEPAQGLEYAKKKDEEEKKVEDKVEDKKPEQKEDEPKKEEGASKEEGKSEEPKKEEGKSEEPKKDEDEEKKKKKLQFNLEEVPEFQALKAEFDNLKTQYAALESANATLTEFKNNVEKAEKEELIKSFYMLSDEDKKDVTDNIMTYSYDEIKAKLCVIGHDKGVSFAKNETDDLEKDQRDALTYNLKGDTSVADKAQKPAWLKCVDKNIGK